MTQPDLSALEKDVDCERGNVAEWSAAASATASSPRQVDVVLPDENAVQSESDHHSSKVSTLYHSLSTASRKRRRQRRNGSSSYTDSGTAQEAADAAAALAQRETRAIAWFRLVVLSVLVASMTGTATAIYLFLRDSEMDAFRASFINDSNNIIEAVAETLYTSLGAVDGYLVSLVSLARATNQTWPFVTVPDASVRLAKLRSLSKAVSVQQAHFVTEEQKIDWINYTQTHNQWATDALRIQKTDKNYHGPAYESFKHPTALRSYKGDVVGEGSFLPTWLSSPFIPGTLQRRLFAMGVSRCCPWRFAMDSTFYLSS
jgi:hypothetical protein